MKSTLKCEARMRRGQGIRRRITGTFKTTTNWRSFLRDDDNKTEIFQFLADRIWQTQTTSTILVTKESCTINDNHKLLEVVSPCLHEEADTRIFVHARDAAIEGSNALVVNANDTDIIVFAVTACVYYHWWWHEVDPNPRATQCHIGPAKACVAITDN